MQAVYKAIAAVAGELAKDGISKDRKNQQQNYNFRGIDDVYNALSPLLAKHGLVILPRFIERDCIERQTKSGGALFYSTVKGEFDFVAVEDGSKHTVTTYGEAMDSADKSTNKAMSAAYKYAAFQAFAIPTEGDNDADAVTHQVAPKKSTPAEKVKDKFPGTVETKDEAIAMLKEARSLLELGSVWQTYAKKWRELLGFDEIEATKDELKAKFQEAA
jgi:hypothetical protein